jgi:hypothetical protein
MRSARSSTHLGLGFAGTLPHDECHRGARKICCCAAGDLPVLLKIVQYRAGRDGDITRLVGLHAVSDFPRGNIFEKDFASGRAQSR